MKQLKMSKTLLLAVGLAVMLVQTGCCSSKNRSEIPWGNQGKTGTGTLPGGMNEKR